MQQAVAAATKPWGQIRLVIFDMDGVIFAGENFWLDLHRAYGTAAEGLDLADQFLVSDYESLAKEVAGRLWKGQSAAAYLRLVATRKYEYGVDQVVGRLRSSGIRTAILSSGSRRLAERAQSELKIDFVRANEVLISDGVLSGEAEIEVPDSEKARVGLELIAEAGATRDSTAFVGDSQADVPFAELVGLPIAYNSRSPELDRVARVRLLRGRLPEMIDTMPTKRARVS